jgi:hypothetical protein
MMRAISSSSDSLGKTIKIANGIIANARHQCRCRSQAGVELFVGGTQPGVGGAGAGVAGAVATGAGLARGAGGVARLGGDQ